jgi:hypothetical protein
MIPERPIFSQFLRIAYVLAMHFKILLKTIPAVLRGEGAA